MFRGEIAHLSGDFLAATVFSIGPFYNLRPQIIANDRSERCNQDGFRFTNAATCSRFTRHPAMALSANTRAALPNSRSDSNTLWAIRDNITFSSNAPDCLPTVTVTSLPIPGTTAIVAALAMTGLILPGMMLEPGYTEGKVISPNPAVGPLLIHRRSLAIFIRLTATVLS